MSTPQQTAPTRTPRVARRTFFLVGLLLALLVAGGLSYYASAHPDGLEHVAEQTGFLDSAEDSATADSPLADYQTEGVDNQRVGGAIAGVAGVLLTLVLMGGLAWAVRRRASPEAAETAPRSAPEKEG